MSSLIVPLVCLCWLMPARWVRADDTSPPLRLESPTVPLGMFFHGARVHVEGSVPAGYELAVVCAGKSSELKLKEKEKVLGLLWLNRKQVTFPSVPSLHLVNASAALARLAPQATLDRLGVGYSSLEAAAVDEMTPESQADELFAELVKLKEKEKLFAVDENGVQIQQQTPQREHWSADIHLPAKLLPGDYEVRLYGFRGGHGELLGTEHLDVRQVGVVALIRSFARQWGFVYGLGAVTIALAVGLLTGMAFGRGSKGGH